MSVSVVLPTYNRRERLQRVLAALERQTFDGPLEVVVVSDGSTDGTKALLDSLDMAIDLVVLEQPNSGPAVARNRGIEAAKHDLIIFVDDDVVPAPDLVAEHVAAHRRAGDGRLVAIGPMLSPDDAVYSPWVAWEQAKLEKQYAMMRAEPIASYRNFYTGNASVLRRHLERSSGFDATLRRAEDVELAFRLHEAGLRFEFCPTIRGFHYAERPFNSWISIAYEYGRTSVEFSRSGQGPLLDEVVGGFRGRHRLLRTFVRALLPRPRMSRIVLATLRMIVQLAHALRANGVAAAALSAMYGLEHYRGVADGVGSPSELFRLIDDDASDRDRDGFRPTFVLEQSLGHGTHAKNLENVLEPMSGIQLDIVTVEQPVNAPWATHVLGWSNWTIRAGVRARNGLRSRSRQAPSAEIQALFVHSHVPAVLLADWLRRIPSIVSLDATGRQYDSFGEYYAHAVGPPWVEQIKFALHRRCFTAANHLVAWSSWARDSLIAEYGVDADKVTIIPPGVSTELWARSAARDRGSDPIGVLFVGGNFERKGGPVLLEAAKLLRERTDVPAFELHIVTNGVVADDVTPVVVHSTMTPNSAELIELFHRCEVFCLPTYGDCLPLVLAEAGAAELALISTDVGAISEIVRPGETGELVEVGDVGSLVEALEGLLFEPQRRQRYGANAGALIRSEHDARANAIRLVELLAEVAGAELRSDWTEPERVVGGTHRP